MIKFLILLLGCWRGTAASTILQMSTTNETLLIQLPTFSQATITSNLDQFYPNVSYLNSTSTSYTMNGTQILEVYHYMGDAAYWAPSQDGLLLFYLQQSITTNYTGLVLYYDGTTNEQFRTVILYNITQHKTIQFDIAAPSIDSKTGELGITVYQTLTFNFTEPVGFNDYVFSCSNVTIFFIGQTNYTLFCENGVNFSMWSIPTFQNSGEIVSFSATAFDNTNLNITKPLSIESALVNPQLYVGIPNTQLVWSLMFSSNNVVYVCSDLINYSSLNSTHLSCSGIEQLEGQVINIIGLLSDYYMPEAFVHTSSALYVLENQQNLNEVMSLNNSDFVFITKQYIYVEIVEKDYTNMTIFDKYTLEEVGQLILPSQAFVVENDLIVTSTPGVVNFLLFSPTYIVIQPQAVPYIQSIIGSPAQINVTIETPYNTSSYSYTLYFSPFNQTLFQVLQTNSSEECTSLQFKSYSSIVVINLAECFNVMGPLVQMLVETEAGQYNANIVSWFKFTINFDNLSRLFNWQVVSNNTPIVAETSKTGQLTANLLFQNNSQVVFFNNATGVARSTNISLEDVVQTFVSDDMVYLLFANGHVQNCSLQYTNCQFLMSFKTQLSSDPRQNILSFRKHNKRAFFSVLNNHKLQLFVKNHRNNGTRVLSMPAKNLPPIDQIVIISLDQGNFGRIGVLSTSNNVSIFVANVNSTSSQSQYPNMTLSYNITLQCPISNSSQMQLQPGTATMIAYCYNQSFVYEYLITNTAYVQTRLIPLYVFVTSNFANFTNTLNYYLVPVTLNGTMPPYVNASQYRLALLFGEMSSSSIKQIVNTSYPIIVVGNIADTIIYPIAKNAATLMLFTEQVFLETDVITTGNSLESNTLPVLLGVTSLFNYNFLENLTVIFNLTSATLNYTAPAGIISFNIVKPNDTDGNYTLNDKSTVYFGEHFITLNDMNGTIQHLSVTNSTPGRGKLPPTIHQIDMIEPNKKIGNVGDYFTSLLQLNELEYPILANTSLTNLIIALSRSQLYILEKIGGNETDLNILYESPTFTQPITSYCQVHLYQVLSNSSANFILDCGITQISLSSYPYVTMLINYTQAGGLLQKPNISQINLPLMLLEITVIPSNDTNVDPLVIGMLPQSGNTASQTMVVCNTTGYSYFVNTQNRTTYVSIDYDVLAGYNQWLVTSLNMEDINFWLSPTPQPNNAPINITCNISIANLKSITDDNYVVFLDLISMTTDSNVTMLVGGYLHYYLVSFRIINGQVYNLALVYTFRKYYECNGYDQLKPEYVFGNPLIKSDDTVNLTAMIIYCTENKTVLSYLSSRNLTSDEPIYTSYVQIFVIRPSDVQVPIRVIDTDATYSGCLLAVYEGINFTNSEDNQPGTISNNVSNLKLVYQQIGGVLIDNRIKSVMGFVVMTNQPPVYNFTMTFSNSYFTKSILVASHLVQNPPELTGKSLPYIIILGLYNLLVVAAMGWWCYKTAKVIPATILSEAKSESEDDELRAYYNRLHEDTKNRSKERIYELEQFQ